MTLQELKDYLKEELKKAIYSREYEYIDGESWCSYNSRASTIEEVLAKLEELC